MPNRPRRVHGVLPATILTILAHVAFFSVIVFGVSWQSQPVKPISVSLVREVAPARVEKVAPPPPAPTPEPPPPPPQPEAVKTPPPAPVREPESIKAAEIEQRTRLEADKRAREKAERERAEQTKAQKLKAERDAREKELAEKKRREDDARKKAEADKAAKEKADKVARDKAERDKAAKADAEKKAAADNRAKVEAEMRAAQRAEFESYVGRIRDKIRGRANIPDSVTSKPKATFRVVLLPTGEVLNVTLSRSSGQPAYDQAIERAIRAAQPLPVPNKPELFPQFRELNLEFEHEK